MARSQNLLHKERVRVDGSEIVGRATGFKTYGDSIYFVISHYPVQDKVILSKVM